MELTVCVGTIFFFLISSCDPTMSIDVKWRRKEEVAKRRSWKGDLMRASGTRWCGQGDGADSVEDLGGYTGADRCCRHHDLGCPRKIGPGETVGGITNKRLANAFHCSCDQRFKNCLKLEGSLISNVVGYLFFEVVNTPCFEDKEDSICIDQTWWGLCRGRKVVKYLEWKDLSWSSDATSAINLATTRVKETNTENTLPVDSNSRLRTTDSAKKGGITSTTINSTVAATNESTWETTKATLPPKSKDTENDLIESKFLRSISELSKSIDVNTNKEGAPKVFLSKISKTRTLQNVSLARKGSFSKTQKVRLPKKTVTTKPVPSSARTSAASDQMPCHKHSSYEHCGDVLPGSSRQEDMMVGLVGGYAALALIVIVSLISFWTSRYITSFLKMWWFKASNVQTCDVNI